MLWQKYNQYPGSNYMVGIGREGTITGLVRHLFFAHIETKIESRNEYVVNKYP